MSKDSNNMASNLVYFLFGMAAGTAIALLYAPQEGDATRRILGEKAGTLKDKAAEYSNNVTQSTRDRFNMLSDSVTSKAQEFRSRIQEPSVSPVDSETEPGTANNSSSE